MFILLFKILVSVLPRSRMKELRPGLQTDVGKATPGHWDGRTVARVPGFHLSPFSTQTTFVLVSQVIFTL